MPASHQADAATGDRPSELVATDADKVTSIEDVALVAAVKQTNPL